MMYNISRMIKKGELSMKRTWSFILALVLIFSNIAVVYGAEEDFYRQAGQILKNIGVLTGSEEGDLMLEQNLKRQDMVVLISRLYKEEEIAKKYPVKNTFDDVTSSFYKPYISWAVDRGLIIGTGANKFGYNEPVKVQQFQTLLLRVLRRTEEAKNYNLVPELAKELKLMDGISVKPTDNLKRGVMAAMTLNALSQYPKGSSSTLAQELNLNIPTRFDVTSNHTIDRNNVKFEGVAKGTKVLRLRLKPLSSSISSGEKYYNIPLEEDGRFSYVVEKLQAGDYEYNFESDELSTAVKTFTIKELPFELDDVVADNLKEIKIHFTAPVDKNSSLFTNKYITNAGTVKSVRLADNDTTVILTLNESMKNQSTYRISINKIKSAKGEELSIKDREFTVLDEDSPRIMDVKQLGNKGLKIFMSEPVKGPKASNFKIDDKPISGQVEILDDVIILKFNSSRYALEEGRHILSVSGLVDYAGFKGIDQNFPFDIVEDKDAPKVIDAYASMEEVVIQFDEDIDPTYISRTNFYWKSGSRKRYPNSVKVLEDKIILDYSKDHLPNYEITLYLDDVRDYSDNRLRDWEIRLKAEVDESQPQVVNLQVSQDGKTITVTFSKNVDGKDRNFYDIRDESGNKVFISSVEGSGREYKIHLTGYLPKGYNTIAIDGIKDTTPLRNRLVPFMDTIYMEDVEAPEIESYSARGNEIIIMFNKDMDISTVERRENYLIRLDNRFHYLPEETEFIPIDDGRIYRIILPERIDGIRVDIGRDKNITELEIRGLRGSNGILMEPEILKFDGQNQGQAIAKEAKLIEADKIVVTFDQPIFYAHESDFYIYGRTIYDVRCDGTKEVVITLLDRYETTVDDKLTIRDKNSIETILETNAKPTSIAIKDEVKPLIDSRDGWLKTSGNTIELPFTEKLDREIEKLFRHDLIIEPIGEEILDLSEYETTLSSDGKTIRITIKGKFNSRGYVIRLVEQPKYIMDTSGNIIEYDGYEYYAE